MKEFWSMLLSRIGSSNQILESLKAKLYKKKEFTLIKKKNEVFEDNVDRPKVSFTTSTISLLFLRKKKCFLEKKNFLEH